MAEELSEIRNDLKKIAEKIEDRFGKVEARLTDITLDLQKVVEDMRETMETMKMTNSKLKIGRQEDQQLEFGVVREPDGGNAKRTVDIKYGRRPCDIKQRSGLDEEEGETKKSKMAAKERGREGNIQKYFFKKNGDGIFNRQNELRDYKIGGKREEQDFRKGKKIDQKKRRRSEGADREDEKGEHKGGDFFFKKKRDEG